MKVEQRGPWIVAVHRGKVIASGHTFISAAERGKDALRRSKKKK